MELKPLALITPKIQVNEIFPALELIMFHQAISESIAETNSQEQRNRLLPTHLIIALVIALSLWSRDSVVDVLKNLVQGLSAKWIPLGMKWKTPSKSSISYHVKVRILICALRCFLPFVSSQILECK